MKTAINATKLAIGAFIVPYMFVYNPQMLMINASALSVIFICATALIGMFGISVALEGYGFRNASVVQRLLFAVAGFLCVIPETKTDIVGLIMMAVLIAYQLVRNSIERKRAVN